jgi:peptidyl-prolyl cis-trans isomerase SurA
MKSTRAFGGVLTAAVLALAMAATAPAVTPAAAQSSQIKIVVNDTAITSMEIQGRSKLLQVANRMGASQANKAAQEELIDEALRMKEAARRGIVVPDAVVDEAIAGIASRSNMSPSQFAAALGQAGVPIRTLKSRLKAQMTWGQIVRARLRAEISAEQDDLIAQMRRQETPAGQVTAEDFVLHRVVFTLPGKAGDGVVQRRRQEAEQLRGRFRGCDEGLAFARGLKEVAVISIGRRLAAEVTPQMRELLKDVPEGRLTRPEVTPQGVEMLAVCERIPVTGESAAASVGYDAETLGAQGEKISETLTRELRQKANIIYR